MPASLLTSLPCGHLLRTSLETSLRICLGISLGISLRTIGSAWLAVAAAVRLRAVALRGGLDMNRRYRRNRKDSLARRVPHRQFNGRWQRVGVVPAAFPDP